MTNKYNKLTCLFGHHDYGKKLTRDKHGNSVHMCKHCKRSACIMYHWPGDVYHDYDKDGNLIHKKWSDGSRSWYNYDEKGTLIYKKWIDGYEEWKSNEGNWTDKKPENWKYEKDLQ